jgi:hypothetical protein
MIIFIKKKSNKNLKGFLNSYKAAPRNIFDCSAGKWLELSLI